MSIITSEGNNAIEFLGLTGEVRENVLRALVGNLKNATWAYETGIDEEFGSSTTRFIPINKTKGNSMTVTNGYTVFRDTDELGMLATNHGIWVKVYPTKGAYSETAETGDLDYSFCVYLTLSSTEPNADGTNVIEPSTVDESTGVCDEPNYARFPLANDGISKYLTICNAETDPAGNEGRNVKVVAAINAAMQQEIKLNRSTKAWSRTYTHFALYTHPTEGKIIAWGKLTNPITVSQADVVPLFEEGKFRLFFPAPNEVEGQMDAEIDSPTY